MRIKHNLVIVLQKFRLTLKNLGIIFWIPIIFTNIITPIIVMISYNSQNPNLNFEIIFLNLELLVFPLSSIIWTPFILQDFLEGKGNELLFLYKKQSNIKETILPFFAFIFISLLQYLFYIKILPNSKYESIRLIVICLFLYTFIQLIMTISKSCVLSFLIILIYYTLNVLFGSLEIWFPLFYKLRFLDVKIIFYQLIPMLFCSVLFLIVSFTFEENVKSYN